ncbi:MAG TPA: MBL fold metallo-hydrolase [Labilithrix sp.]|jgi:L-ascorbate metabolism protein UlaG (beta-lactamase superfamily)
MKRAAILVLALCASGCVIGRGITRAGDSFFRSPKPVQHPASPVAKNARLAVTWIGHATALVQIDDKLILTDPVFTSTVGQFSKRLYEPGIDAKDLPPVDAVIVSHLHFDHLSLGSLAMIEPKVKQLLVPSTGTTYVTDFSFPVVELRWWQAWEKDGLRITSVPVDHVGYRYGADDAWMKVGFTGYVIDYHGIRVYFAGDTAYDQKLFLETAERYPGIDLALLPIGPIEPREIMRRFHVDPRESVQAFIDLKAKRMVPVHYATFVNSVDDAEAELRELDRAKARWTLGDREIDVVKIGEQRVFLKKGEEPVKLRPDVAPKPAASTSAPPPPKKTMPKDEDLDSD